MGRRATRSGRVGHARPSLRRPLGWPASCGEVVLLPRLRGQLPEADWRWRTGHRAHGCDAERGFLRRQLLHPRPVHGRPFPANVIPADRIDPAAHAINVFYPLPNQGTLPNGFGVFQQFVPLDRRRDRADLRVDHELTSRDSLFARTSWQRRDPDAFTFEAGSAPTLLGILDRRAQALTVVAGWTRVLSHSAVNELRMGYNLHDNRRRSRFVAGSVADQLGIEVPAGAREARGFPTFNFSGAKRPTNVQDQRVNAFHDLRGATLSASDTLSLVAGRHSLKLGASLTPPVREAGLAYIVTVDGVSNVWRQPLGGGAPRPVTDFTSDRMFDFAWSRDGRVLARRARGRDERRGADHRLPQVDWLHVARAMRQSASPRRS